MARFLQARRPPGEPAALQFDAVAVYDI